MWLFIFLPTIITANLFLLSKFNQGMSIAFSWLFVSQLLSLIGTTLLSLTYVLSARWGVVEKWLGGLDKVYKLHQLSGTFAFVFLIHHPILLAINSLPQTKLSLRYLLPGTTSSYNYGVFALYSLILLLILTLLVNLPYHLWKKTHEIMGIALLFASLHILTITSDVSRDPTLRLWIIFLLTISSAAFLYRRFFYRWFGPRFRYQIDAINRIGNYFEIYLSPLDKPLHFEPGQFVFLSVKNRSIGSESHPFSLASDPNNLRLRLVIKILGDYTSSLQSLSAGQKVDLLGPYGQFGRKLKDASHALFIAGGIGITPFLSLVPSLLNSNSDKNIDLYYSVKSEGEAYGNDELSALSRNHPNFHYHLVDTSRSGRFTISAIEDKLNPSDTTAFICGPLSMMESLADQLVKTGMSHRRIIYEDFSLR